MPAHKVDTKLKYLGLHLDQRFTWNKHMQSKRQMYWLVRREFKLISEQQVIFAQSDSQVYLVV